jgi:acetyl-CoA/propionyl-CoA carboxylase, biotin carboxylase, biotin carboxyl carrier protein
MMSCPSGFHIVLIANRGEIALRIVRACRDEGLTSVAVYADEDRDAPFAVAADQAVALGGASAADSYLDIEKLLAAAKDTRADAVHPGYGFLSENAEFAQAVIDAGLVWIGPPPEVIRELGDKVTARAIAARAGAPFVAGSDGPVADADEAAAFAARHGLPIAIKAAHGGGGRGLRVARHPAEIPELFAAVVSEATMAFGRGECFVERYIERGRHVEAQVLADEHGNVIVVGTRDCTLQRRHQKVVEEAPAPYLTDGQRSEIHRAAAAICRTAGYIGAGTVEFLLAPDGALSFLEVNTRLQVEHPVTEETTDIDLVREQFRIAAGHRLSLDGDPAARRHAIEFRINAEDPARFLPGAGTVTRFRAPAGPGVRVDAGVRTGSVVSGRFDSLLAKLIVVGADRRQALERARRALGEFEISGVPTTLPFLRNVVEAPAFTADSASGFAVHTRWIEEEYMPAASGAADDPPDTGPMTVRIGGRSMQVEVPGLAAAADGPLAAARIRGRQRGDAATQTSAGAIVTPMQGTVVRVAVQDGDLVAAGDLIAVVEAMKMENPLTAPHPGRVTELSATAGDTIAQGTLICRVVADPADGAEPPTDR